MSAPARPTLVDYVTTFRKDTQMTTYKPLVICPFDVQCSEVFVEIMKVKERKIIRADKRWLCYFVFMLMARWQGRSMLF